jgi:hypothetical protein
MGLGEKDQCVLIALGDRAQEPVAEFLGPAFAFEVLVCAGGDIVYRAVLNARVHSFPP